LNAQTYNFVRRRAIGELQVIGVPDDRLGEQVAAWIRLKDGQTCTQQEIVDFCKGKASRTVVCTI